MPRILSVLLAVLALIWAGTAGAASNRSTLERTVERHRSDAWRWQRLMGLRATPPGRAPERLGSAVVFWRHEAGRAWRRALSPPHRSAWLCIHRYEGAWDANTGNGYYGGLQMDLAFQRYYAPRFLRRKGTADRWTPLEQIWVAERARRSGRGFRPWPATARACRLI